MASRTILNYPPPEHYVHTVYEEHHVVHHADGCALYDDPKKSPGGFLGWATVPTTVGSVPGPAFAAGAAGKARGGNRRADQCDVEAGRRAMLAFGAVRLARTLYMTDEQWAHEMEEQDAAIRERNLARRARDRRYAGF